MITTEIFGQLFDQSHSAVCVTAHQQYIYANKAFFDLVGVSNQSDVVGMPLRSFAAGPQRDLTMNRNIERESGGLVPSSYEMMIRKLDGTVFPASVSASTMSLNGEVATLVILKDISLEKSIAEELENITHMMVALYENTADSVIILDRNFSMVYFNKTVSKVIDRVFGSPPEKGDSIFDYTIMESKQDFIQNVNNAFNGVPLTKELMLTYPSGDNFWWRVGYNPILIEGEETKYIAFTATDISEIVQARENLRLQNERLNSLHELMIIQDLTEKEIVEFALEEVVRLTKSEVGYLHFVETQVAGDLELNLFSWSKSVEGKCMIPTILKYPIKDAGVWVDCLRTGKPAVHNDYQHMEGKHGYPEGHFQVERHMSVPVFEDDTPKLIVGVGNKKTEYTTEDIRDFQIYSSELWKVITKKRRIDDLKRAKELAEKAARLKSDFLSQMSHEIRSPMNVILGSIDILRDELENPDGLNLDSTFTAIENSGQRIVRTLNMILNMSELQTGNFIPHIRVVDLKSVLKKLASEYIIKSRHKGLDFVVNLDEGDHFVIGDEYSLTQIFGNLIDNAIKYTDEGMVKITSSVTEEKKLIVEVADTGIGISEEFRDIIFAPFRQEDQGYGRNFEGNGLGLALVKKYCDINEAEIYFESEKSKGTRFFVKLKETTLG